MEKEKSKKLNTSHMNDSYIENNNNRIININNEDMNNNHKRRISLYTKNVLIYGWGKNKYGEMGIGHNTNINSPFPLKSFQNQLIKAISSGGKHTAVLLENGSIFLCGADVFNLLGTESRKWKEQHKFQKMTLLENEVIVQVACAEFHTICLNAKGEVFSWGGTLSKLGKQNTNKPFLVNSLLSRKIIEISCGDHHSAVLSDQGEIFTWGGGGQYNKGQCGHENLKEVENPKRVEFFMKNKKKAIKVVCGGYHTMVLCDDNQLFGFGKGTYGQLGCGGSEDSSVPKLVKFSKVFAHFEKDPNQIDFSNTNLLENLTNLENNATLKSSFANAFSTNTVLIKDIRCGGEHTLVLSHQGRLYSFGHGYTGQLGQGNSQNFHYPMLVKSLLRKQIISIAAGWSHSMILTSQNYLYVAGCGKYGELGLEDDENRKNFTLLRSTMNLNISKIFAGGHHSWIIVDARAPEKPELHSPSPIGSGGNTPPSGGQSPRNLLGNNTNLNNLSVANNNNINNENKNLLNSKSKLDQKLRFDLDLLAGKFVNRERFILQVAYTDLRICHRFIRFAIPTVSRFKDISYRDLNTLMQNYFKSDRGVISFRLQDDSDVNFKNTSGNANIAFDVISKEVRNNFKLNLNKKNFYSVIVVYDYTKNPDFLALKSNIDDIKMKENISSSVNKSLNHSFFDIINLNEEDIRTSEVEKILSGWVVDFHENFRELLEDPNEITEDFPKYLELRPQEFYIS